MNAGAQQATAPVLVFLHADTWLPPDAGRAARRVLEDPLVAGGGFWKVFRDPHPLMAGSRWRCWTRWRFFGRFAGDQAIFVRRAALERSGGFPAIPLMEEFELCRQIRRTGRLVLADATVSTSSRRWRERGVVRTYWKMACVTTLYHVGFSPQRLAALYERR